MTFTDRRDAGKLLAEKLAGKDRKNTVVIGLTRGGVVVAAVIADKLKLELVALVVKKIPSPINQELAIGAITQDGIHEIDRKLAAFEGADEVYIQRVKDKLDKEIKRLQQYYRSGYKPVKIGGKQIILTDDGAATGATIKACIKWIRSKNAAAITVAVPVAPAGFAQSVKSDVDEVVVLFAPPHFQAVGEFYRQFGQITDEEVVSILSRHI